MDKEKIFACFKQGSGEEIKKVGFDGAKPRLGWFSPPDFEEIDAALSEFLKIAESKDEFIFVGMGGSINGIKALLNLKKSDYIHALDSLDPKAIERVLSKINNLKKTLVCPITKSGTTKETQNLAYSLKDVFGESYKDNFLWITDPASSGKLDSLGWAGTKKIPIQVNAKDDIGGRFSSPHTLVFLAPLILILDRNKALLRKFWQDYLKQRDKILNQAFSLTSSLSKDKSGKFQIEAEEGILGGFSNWATQLFQESLGSKIEGFSVKTVITAKAEDIPGFSKIRLDMPSDNWLLYTASLMYYLQLVVALFSYQRQINFVSQPYVEVYKKELRNLEDKEVLTPEAIDLGGLADAIGSKLKPGQEFIDCVLYFSADADLKHRLHKIICAKFPSRLVSIFEGSDWNHHSYQAAFKDERTLFVIVSLDKYSRGSKFVSAEKIESNIKMLKAISYATYKTLQDKSLYLSFLF